MSNVIVRCRKTEQMRCEVIRDHGDQDSETSISSLVTSRRASFLHAMNVMRKEGQLCDVTLTAESKQIQAHKVVLAAASSFFHAMFTSRMAEAKSSMVDLQDVTYDTVEAIVNFAYTAQVDITDDNVQELLSAANLYQIAEVKEACCQYLKSQFSPSNCIGIRDFADFHNCVDLRESGVGYIDENFTEVCKETEFLLLEQPAVMRLLSRDELKVRCEDQVYDAAVDWIRYKDDRPQVKKDILSMIRFPLISRKYLTTEVQQEPLLQNCCDCLKMVIDGMQRYLLCEEDQDNMKLQSVTPRAKKFCYQIALFGGAETSTCQYFCPKSHVWQDFTPMPEKRRDHAVALVKNMVYVIGGSYLFPVGRIDSFNIATQKWTTSRARLQTARDCLAVCSYKGIVYISGGTQSHGSTAMKNMESYCPSADVMTELCPMSQARFEHGLVECRGCLYACGGATNINSRPLKHCEEFNLTLKRWAEVAPLITARRDAGFVVYNRKIYAFGGLNESGPLDTVECYDPVFNCWVQKAKMPYKLRAVKCGLVDGSVWIVSGCHDNGRLRHALRYNVAEDRWVIPFQVRTFPISNSAVVTVDTCVVD